ncbi:hypothetical protein EJ110_NYTH02061 [Nymphaea thermarum]|nr:hypothetical protein EJ110_NYTH02061 [Nymphaea thermarum]
MGIDPVTHKPRLDLSMLTSLPSLDQSLRLQTDAAQLAGIYYLQNLLQAVINANSCSLLLGFNDQPPILQNYQLENLQSYADLPMEQIQVNPSLDNGNRYIPSLDTLSSDCWTELFK